MAHESKQGRKFFEIWAECAQDAGVNARWTKLQEANKRGVPDFHLWVARDHRHNARCQYGPGAWCETKRRAWPNKAQAMRLAAISGRGEPAYVLRLTAQDWAELYHVRTDAATKMHANGGPCKEMYQLMIEGNWESVAHAFVDMMLTDWEPASVFGGEE